MKQELANQSIEFFEAAFSESPEYICFSPGRINIIGEHIDYNDGFVLPAAIDRYVCMVISESDDTTCTIVAGDINDRYEFDISDVREPSEKMWVNYFLGVLAGIEEKGHDVKPFKLAFTSSIPIGAGLSSSAAVECGFGFALNEVFGLEIDKEELALIGQKAEHTFVGVNCGIMDQFASIFGKEGHVIKLDCNTLEYDYHKADFGNHSILLLDSNVKHTLQASEYNTRRQEVENGLSVIREKYAEVRTFRDCREEHVIGVRDNLGETVFKRCLYVVYEIQRVLDAVEALDRGDIRKLGELMYETHDGLANEYEVSCDETDFLVNSVRNDERVLGARMMGGGFGGCTVNIVEKGHENDVIKHVSESYKNEFGIELKPYRVAISDGTSFERL